MGEMSDWILEQVDWFGDDMTEYGEDADYYAKRPSHACRYCNTGGFYWGRDTNGKWRLGTEILMENGMLRFEVHSCEAYYTARLKK